MKINVKVTPRAKHNLLKNEGGVLRAYLTAPAVDGKANKALISLLAEHFNVRKSAIGIIKGLKSREKIININDNITCETQVRIEEE